MQKLNYIFSIILLLVPSVLGQGTILELSTQVDNWVEVIAVSHVFQPQGPALDVNGDGVTDMLTFSKQNNKLIVRSGNSSQTWEYPLGDFVFHNITWTFLGFFEMNNESPNKEALFAHKVGRLHNQVTILNQMAQMNMQFLAIQFLTDIADIDDDGIEELQLFNKDTGFLEIWGPGPKLELFPSIFSLVDILINAYDKEITYFTEVNGEKLNIHYKFLESQTVEITVKDGAGNILLFYNPWFSIPEIDDEVVAWLLTQNLINSSSVGLIPIWGEFKDSFSDEAEAYASNGLGGIIGGIIGLIPDLVDAFCRSGGSATCTDDFGTVTIECDCGVPSCVTQQVAVTVRIVTVDANTGQRTEREEIQYKEKCVCTCMKLKDTQS
jgi:hypothetical protein